MRPPKREPKDFEKVVIGDFIIGEISDIQYDMEHRFKGFQGAEDRIAPAIRFIFTLEGCQDKHYSRYMSFNVGEKANLYKKYLVKLVENAKPDMDIDLDVLKGMKVKTLWAEKNDFQSIESIFPLDKKVSVGDMPSPMDMEPPEAGTEEVPF